MQVPAPRMENGTGPRRPIPFQAPGQGNNPNTALTRPQAMNPLTLVGPWLAVLLVEEHLARTIMRARRPFEKSTLRGTFGGQFCTPE
jgi:hypothetical protein